MARTTTLLLTAVAALRISSATTRDNVKPTDLQGRRAESVDDRGRPTDVSRMEPFAKSRVDHTVARSFGQGEVESTSVARRSPEKEPANLAHAGATIIREVVDSSSASGSQEIQGVVRWHTPTASTNAEGPNNRWPQSTRVESPPKHRRPSMSELGRGLLLGGICAVIRLAGDANSLGILRTAVGVEAHEKMGFQNTFTIGVFLGVLRSFAMAFVGGVWIIVFGGLGLDLFRDSDIGDYVNGVALLLCALRFSVWGPLFPPPPVERKQLSNDALCFGKLPLPGVEVSATSPSAPVNGDAGSVLRVLDTSAVLSPADLVGAVCLARLGLDALPVFIAGFVLVSGLGNAAMGACWNALAPLTDAVKLDSMAGRLSCSFAAAVGVMWMLLRPRDLLPSFRFW